MIHPEQQRALDYLSRKGTHARLAQLRDEVQHAFRAMETELDAVPASARGVPPMAGKWSPHQILDHLVLSHGPAVAQLANLLAGGTSDDVAIPADLQTPPERLESWDALRARLGTIHVELEDLLAGASDDASPEPKAMIEMVVKVGGKPVHWQDRFDWKAVVQAIRVHVLEHREQLRRALE